MPPHDIPLLIFEKQQDYMFYNSQYNSKVSIWMANECIRILQISNILKFIFFSL